MTSVYGVTKYGARAQIDNQLRHNIDNFPPELVYDARAYLAEKTFECLYIMFTTNKAIQVCGLLFALWSFNARLLRYVALTMAFCQWVGEFVAGVCSSRMLQQLCC